MADQVSIYPTGVVVSVKEDRRWQAQGNRGRDRMGDGKGYELVLIIFSGVRATETRLAKSKPWPSLSPQNALHPGRNLLLMVQNLFRAASTARQAVQRSHSQRKYYWEPYRKDAKLLCRYPETYLSYIHGLVCGSCLSSC
jgi:hypothetical protein